jgi:predicted Fe-S protein YdhL (DUF1289 family)
LQACALVPTMPPSPCVGCQIDDALGLCLGCGRTGDEIAAWRGLDETGRADIWRLPPAYLDGLGLGFQMLPLAGPALASPGHNIPSGLALQRATMASSQAVPNVPKNAPYAPSLHHLDGEPGELVVGDVLGGAGGLAGDELEAVAGRDVDGRTADLCAPASPWSLSLAVPKNRLPFLCTQRCR